MTVPAGTFDAYRVDAIGVSEGVNASRHEITLWIAPDKCRRPIVRNEIRRNQYTLLLAERSELVSFRQG